MKDFMKKMPLGKVAVVAIAVVTGIGTVLEAINGNKVEGEIDGLKKELSMLKREIQK